MKIRITLADQIFTIKNPYFYQTEVDFLNISEAIVTSPNTRGYCGEKYYYVLRNSHIYGSRACLSGDELFLDCPTEWDKKKLFAYVAKVNAVHKSEFSYLSDIDVETGTATLIEGRPYLKLDSPAIFCGCVEAWNFGFFISVLMYKVYLANKLDHSLPILVPVQAKWQCNLLKYIFPEKEFIFFDPAHPVFGAEIYVIGWPNFGFHMDEDYVDQFRRKITYIMCPNAKGKFYLSRRKFRNGEQRLGFSNSVENELLKKGFLPVYPEQVSYSDLHELLWGCSELIVESGSALFNSFFLPANAKVTLAESREGFLLNHSRFLSSLNLRAKVVYFDESSVDQLPNCLL